MTSGDGWTSCAAGHRHWGRFGAAGLLLVDDDRVILQHRAAWTHEGDSWGVPGGARNSDEDALAAAVREAGEEAALQAGDIDPIGLYIDDHDGWTYTTVVGRTTRSVHPIAANAESVSVRWHRIAEVADLRLHRGFAAAWQHLRNVPRPLFLILHPTLAGHPLPAMLARTGIPVHRLPPDIDGGGLTRLLPHPITAGTAPAIEHYRRLGQVVLAEDTDALERLGA
ncbi:MAG TPA: NUDIX hydrolase [Jatrophihabitans sp.]|nr:NUDIX hydrolase [Jatrophihabitans sp.]